MALEALLILKKNPVDIYTETSKILLKIADNIFNSPGNLQIRVLQLSNQIISKILKVPGAIECLEFMGFQKNDTSLTLDVNISMKNLKLVRIELLKLRSNSNQLTTEYLNSSANTGSNENTKINLKFKRVVLPPVIHVFNNMFLMTMEVCFHKVLQYEDKNLQLRALHLLPLKRIEIDAQNKLRILQQHMKRNVKNDTECKEIDLQDFMILELLNWFKYEFFEWVDCLDCELCGGKSVSAGRSSNIDLLVHDGIEIHKCLDCGSFTYFARFTDLNILLETRRGRCGEWANAFMLFCRALGWDTRIVYDEHDHVWNEIFSYGQNRWLHCDPCEASCDAPLVYESGWHKEITYVIAYSCDEIQDVTWRYTNQHFRVLKRRIRCAEMELANALDRLRKIRQRTFSEARRIYLAKRCLGELVEMMIERRISDAENHGRISGIVPWKLTRNEIRQQEISSYIWTFSTDQLKTTSLVFKYSASRDIYEVVTKNTKDIKKKWQMGIFISEGIFRKVEKDWNMAYICNKEDVTEGFLTWKFEITDSSYIFDEIDIKLGHRLFENGRIIIKLASVTKSVTVQPSALQNHRKLFYGETSLLLTAILVSGKSWQHAQLFRQTLDDIDFPFIITFIFKKK